MGRGSPRRAKSGGWKSETKASVESAPSEAVRVALLQASLPAAGAAARHHITQISAFVFTWRSPVRESPSLLGGCPLCCTRARSNSVPAVYSDGGQHRTLPATRAGELRAPERCGKENREAFQHQGQRLGAQVPFLPP